MKRKLTKEIKRSIKTAIVAAFGFLIALVWRDLIVEFVSNMIKGTPAHGKLVTAIIITVISVVGIFITSKIIKTR